MASALVTAPVAVAKAFSPGHLTGFFEIPQVRQHYLQRGSKGAGFSIEMGVTTSVSVYESSKPRHRISINGIQTGGAEVSEWVVAEYLKLASKPYFVSVEHDIRIPIGFGLGSSGAAALSLSYALNQALDTGLTQTQAAQVAHHAEIACKTGLGTVIAEYVGGFEMRMNAGAPGVGTIEKIKLDGYNAVILCLSPISTKLFLTNHIDMINGLGGKMLKKLSNSKSPTEFMKMSHEFAKTLDLTEGKCKAPIEALREKGFDASVALFGETVFTLVPKERSQEAAGVLKNFGGTLLVCNIDSYGARVL